MAAEEEREKQPVSMLVGIQETRQPLELMLRWLKRSKFPGLTKTVVVVEAKLERAGQATAEKDCRTNLTATCPSLPVWVKRMKIQVKKASLKVLALGRQRKLWMGFRCHGRY